MRNLNGVVETNSREVPFTLLKQEESSNTLGVVLPGSGYTTQAPLLYYSTGALLSKGFDVVHVNYKYSNEELPSLNENEFTHLIMSVIDHILTENKYSDFYIVGKSLGTIAMPYLLKNPILHQAKAIWLTPLLTRDDIYESLLTSKNKGICIIGDKDPFYIPERFESIKNNPNLNSELIPNVNHSLEIEKFRINSVEVIKDIINKIEKL
ncbi:alpha/beta family hydrolase [Anaerobacillus isosaccharinicus]|uniref:Alpha/beta hydrolase n=1 Tax=Anaerobacillus isosaccharinicus TaxID=1532552 RepID=A0A1S2M6S5_9BACI|nr:alpha/beta hydrolase [Anaerobacillus isosaccharinicus]MBA5587074.1 alpha/beta hydrolase [Anaerobacillus isosaccharinicus]QOY34730.1 alpha/beta hydrolase [Anaerobacillus isosaccharinicus]